MSDYDDDDLGLDGDGEEQQVTQTSRKGKEKARHRDDDDEEQALREDRDDDDDDEEDEDDEEEEDRGQQPKKRKRRKIAVNSFLDVYAEVSDDDEEEEEEDEEVEGFMYDDADDAVNGDTTRRQHVLLDNRRQQREEKTAEQIAKDLTERYGGIRAAPRYTGDLNDVPQRLLMPSVHDAGLWQVRVKPGRERDIVFSLMRKSIDMEYTAHPLSILSAFQRESLSGMIYVEARSQKHVQQACNGLVGVYLSKGVHLVPIEEMASLLTIKKQDVTVTYGMWVRIRKHPKYGGDLAQVIIPGDGIEDVAVRLVPRIDMNPPEETSMLDPSKKRKKAVAVVGAARPPQKLFNVEEVAKAYSRKSIISKLGGEIVFQGETYKNGFVEKDIKINNLILDDVQPTLDEISMFMSAKDGSKQDDLGIQLRDIAESSRKAAIAVLQPGDNVEVFEGEQAGIHGVVEEISGEVVTITAMGVDIEGQKLEIPARSIRKRFKQGEHVKVMAGMYTDETGLVTTVQDDKVTFLSDLSMTTITVFAKDLRIAAEVGTGTNTIGNYELHDLVQLDAATVGVIFKTERDSFRVLDQNGKVLIVKPHQISMRRDSSRAIASDAEGHELRANDNVKEVDGEQRKGRVLHTHQSFYAFLHNREITEHGGVFVARARSLVSLAPKGNALKNGGADLSKMNPAMMGGGMVGSGALGRGPRDRHIGVTVMVTKGPHKGYGGTIKDTNGNTARVELRTGNKMISIDKDKLRKIAPNGDLLFLHQNAPPGNNSSNNNNSNSNAWGAPPSWTNSGGASGGRTPFQGSSSKTPNPYAVGGGKTPAWAPGSRTPNPYAAESGKTPAWNAGSKTPNPYADGGRTPAWNVSSRTPNPYATGANAGASSGTAYGGATPARSWDASANSSSGWLGAGSDGSATPRQSSWGNDWVSAPTPAAAATPGFNVGLTPAFGALTPAAAQTPAGVFNSAASSATPAASGGYALAANDNRTLESDWLFDPAVVPHHPRIKIQLLGTHVANYLGGEYEQQKGKVIAGNKAPSGYEQTATVLFESGEQRSVVARYIAAVPPSHNGEEVLIAGGKQKGAIMVVREDPDDETVTVSSRSNPGAVFAVPKELLIALYDEKA
ncbi:transcription elongation factor SPT5 [Coprinopsis marcescibilis]|uniref:Transcription elongation factor SPT5 n=1 Tax=Coprinopsis marcescibilis TaxID=230819 RepID=A0A5C3KYZ8_COPMA|nr:transcription elongation factor SPT5 [Coprinopsis marcescibilis]